MSVKVSFGLFKGESPSLLSISIFEVMWSMNFIVLLSIKIWKFVFELTIDL